MNYNESLYLARYLINTGTSLADAIVNPAIALEFRSDILKALTEEQTITLRPANMIVDDDEHTEWLNYEDRSDWYYWPILRQYLLTKKGWSNHAIQSLDKETDRILSRLAAPVQEAPFDKRGLVLGYVQSGKTSNYTALIAKAADAGYRLIIVLTGTDNSLRLQTHRRLKKELVGTLDGKGVPIPPGDKLWVEFTRDELNGDFQAGFVNNAPLQGSQPVMLVIKKNGAVLRRLLGWLENASEEMKKTVPLLMIDDESDLASVDTRGSYQTEEQASMDGYEAPSVINGLIRKLLSKFSRKSYIAYTATPFANFLIPPDNYDPKVSDDLYPRNFIIDLPKPQGYFGAEELFGIDEIPEESPTGIDVIRHINDQDLTDLDDNKMPRVMEKAILSFILAGAIKKYRSTEDFPATMLIHTDFRIQEQLKLAEAVEKKFTELKDEWRYIRKGELYDKLNQLWIEDFKPLIEQQYPENVLSFEELEFHINSFFESVKVKVINSDATKGEALDYEKEPYLKSIAVGGNKLSRGLTLEGLLVSFFARRSSQYDTLMQMGRWFGFRGGYEDLTRIYITPELAQWFSDLAKVEHELRDDIKLYEEQQLTPLEVGMRIRAHHTMQVTSAPKRRFASEMVVAKSYSGKNPQTITFPLNQPDELALRSEKNLIAVKGFLSGLGKYITGNKGPIWKKVSPDKIIEFLKSFINDESSTMHLQLISSYIDEQRRNGELLNWTVAVCGREEDSGDLGEADWGLGIPIKQISRTRVGESNSIKVLRSPSDEKIDLVDEELKEYQRLKEEKVSEDKAARQARSPMNGLLMIYPISRNSRPDGRKDDKSQRRPLYNNLEDSRVRDLIGLAISFPFSKLQQPSREYVVGKLGWKQPDDPQ